MTDKIDFKHKLYVDIKNKYSKKLHTGYNNEINYTKDIFNPKDYYCERIITNFPAPDVIEKENLLCYYYYWNGQLFLFTKNQTDCALLRIKHGL